MMRRVFLVVFALFLGVAALTGQQDTTTATHVPPFVRNLIVQITSEGEFRQEDGAGIVVGADSNSVYIITAKHVVEEDSGLVFRRIVVRFGSSSDSTMGRVERLTDDAVDLAVIRIDREVAEQAGVAVETNRLGVSGQMHQGDPVSPVGCPQGICWEAPLPPDQILSANNLAISFQSTFVKGGSSGGALFNQWWEVVGVVTDEQPPRAEALPIDFIMRQLADWEIPVTLTRAAIPRNGYGTSIGVTWLMPTQGGGFHGRVPSGRLSVTIGLRSLLNLTISGVRIAPKRVGNSCPGSPSPMAPTSVQVSFRSRLPCEAVINAVMAGLSLPVGVGRLTTRPFAELGMGRTRARFDVGGFFEDGTLHYTPNLRALEQTAFGFGGGLSMEFVLIPRIILEGIAGYWTFNDPFEGAELPNEYKPEVPKVFFGFGLRWGL